MNEKIELKLSRILNGERQRQAFGFEHLVRLELA